MSQYGGGFHQTLRVIPLFFSLDVDVDCVIQKIHSELTCCFGIASDSILDCNEHDDQDHHADRDGLQIRGDALIRIVDGETHFCCLSVRFAMQVE